MDTSCSELSIEVMRNVPGGVDWEGGSRLLETGTVRHVQEGTSQLDRHCITEPSPFTPPPLLFAPLKTSTPKVNTVASVRNGEAVSGNAGVTKAVSSKGSKKHAAKTAQCKREITDKGEEKVTEPEREREREKPKRGQKVTEPKRGKKKDEGYERGARAKKKDAESRRRREDRRTVSKGSVRAAKPKRRGKKDPTEGRTVKGDKENGKAVEAHAASKKKARLVVAGQKKDGSGDVPPKAMRSKLLPLQERSLPNQCYDSSTASTESTLMNQLLDFDEIGFEASQNLRDMPSNETAVSTPLPHHTPTAAPLLRPQYPDPITVPIPQWYQDELEAKHCQSTGHTAQSRVAQTKTAMAHTGLAKRTIVQHNRDILTAGLPQSNHISTS